MKATTRMLAGLAFAAGLLCALGPEEQDSEAPLMSLVPAEHQVGERRDGVGSGNVPELLEAQSLQDAIGVQGVVSPSHPPVGATDSDPQTASD